MIKILIKYISNESFYIYIYLLTSVDYTFFPLLVSFRFKRIHPEKFILKNKF